MRSGVIAQKLGMTRVYNDAGEHVPVTVLRMESCQVVAQRTKEKNGYTAVQLGVGLAKVKNTSKAMRGHFAAASVEPKAKLAEFRVSDENLLEVDDTADELVGAAGIVPAGATRGGMRGALRGDVGERPVIDLIARLRSTLSFYLNRPGASAIHQVLITGAGAVVNGLIPGLQEKSEVPVRLVSIGDVVGMREGAVVGETALNLVSTVGLALGKDS